MTAHEYPTESGMECSLLIKNAFLLTMNAQRTVYPRGAIAIDRGRIIAVGRERDLSPRFEPTRTIDARGGVVHPGFFDCHAHVTLHTTRGAFPEPADIGNNSHYLARWYGSISDEDEYISTKLASIEMLHNGITTFMEPGTAFEPDAVASAIHEVGLRGSVAAPWIWDRTDSHFGNLLMDRAPAEADHAIRILDNQLWRNTKTDSRVRGHIALYGIGSASDELIKAAKACADANDAFLTMHQNFASEDIEFDDERFGKHSFVHFHEIGTLGENCCFAHVNAVRDDEFEAIVSSGMSIAWVPSNSLYWGTYSKYRSRFAELHAKGVPVALGTDIGKNWAFGDQAQVGYLSVRSGAAGSSARSLLEMATVAGAAAMRVSDELGSIEPGKRADIVIRRSDLPEAYPDLDPVLNLMFVARGKTVRTVIVDGRVVLDDGVSTLVDEPAVFAQANASTAKLQEQAGIPARFPWPVVE